MPATDRYVRIMPKDKRIFGVRASYDERRWGWVAQVLEGDLPTDPVWAAWEDEHPDGGPALGNPYDCISNALDFVIRNVDVDTVR